jgi:hypothetical protein
MKGRHKKALSALMIFVAITVGGCAAQTPCKPAPAMPSFTTDQQEVCGHSCRSTYDSFARECTLGYPYPNQRSMRNACLDSAATSLEQCYQACK